MSILQGLFRKTNGNDGGNIQITSTPTYNGTSDIASVRIEISNLKRSVTSINSRQRVSKKQRDALITKVISALDRAEGALVRASND